MLRYVESLITVNRLFIYVADSVSESNWYFFRVFSFPSGSLGWIENKNKLVISNEIFLFFSSELSHRDFLLSSLLIMINMMLRFVLWSIAKMKRKDSDYFVKMPMSLLIQFIIYTHAHAYEHNNHKARIWSAFLKIKDEIYQ